MLLDLQMPKKNGIQVVQEVKLLYAKARMGLQIELLEPTYVFLTAFSTNALRSYL